MKKSNAWWITGSISLFLLIYTLIEIPQAFSYNSMSGIITLMVILPIFLGGILWSWSCYIKKKLYKILIRIGAILLWLIPIALILFALALGAALGGGL